MHQTLYLTILPLLWVHCLFLTRQLENWQMSLLAPHLPVVSLNDQLSLFWTNCLFSWPVVSIVDQPLTQLWPLRPSPQLSLNDQLSLFCHHPDHLLNSLCVAGVMWKKQGLSFPLNHPFLPLDFFLKLFKGSLMLIFSSKVSTRIPPRSDWAL